MKTKKIIAILCTASILLMNNGTFVHAENLSDTAETSTERFVPSEENAAEGSNALLGDTISAEELSSLVQVDSPEKALVDTPDLTIPKAAEESTAELLNTKMASPDMDAAILIKDLAAEKKSRSAGSVTQQFTDVLTAEGESKYVQFSLAEGEIVNTSLVCPKSANLDYDLVLASVAADGSATAIQSSALVLT